MKIKLWIIGLMVGLLSTSAMAQHYSNHYHYYPPRYHHDHGFIRGAVTGAIVGGIIYDATRPRVYVSPGAPVYYGPYGPDPTWIVTYRQEYDFNCNCSVLVRYYQDPYGRLHRYP